MFFGIVSEIKNIISYFEFCEFFFLDTTAGVLANSTG
jgi:hypothetical protein